MIAQIILALILLVPLVYVQLQSSSPRSVKLLITMTVLAGEYLILFPGHSGVVAAYVGIGRGVDLIMYIWLIVSFAMIISLFFSLRMVNQDLIRLSQQIALSAPSRPAEPTSDE